ncbi:MAG: class I SAM-dependent methyltransferase [Pseudomonadota bacterium]
MGSSSSDWAGSRGDKWVHKLAAMEAMLAPIDEPLLAALDLSSARCIADLGCGGGATTRALAARSPNATCIHGIDISAANIEYARAQGHDQRLVFYRRNLESTDPAAVAYDRLCSRFGTMFFEAPRDTFSALASWLTPEGRFAFAVWAPAVWNRWMQIVREAVATEVTLPASKRDAPGQFRYARADLFVELLEDSGFTGVSFQTWTGRLPLGGGVNAREAAAFALSAFSVGGLLGDDAEKRSRVLCRLGTALSPFEDGGVVMVDAAAHIVTGRRS